MDHRPEQLFDLPRLSRRAFARVFAAAGATLLASGCRELGSHAIRLRFWNGFTGPDGPIMLRLVRVFNAQNDDVQVVMQRVEWGTYYNKLFVAGLGGRSPDAFVVHTENIERFHWAKLLAPVDEVFTSGITPDEIDANVLGPAQRAGITYGLPLDVHPCGLYYNRALFEQAGIAAPPETRAQFFDVLHKLRRSDVNGGQWGFVYEWLRVNLWTLIRQWGGNILSPDRSTVVFDSPAVRDALAFAAALINEFKLVPEIQNMNAFNGFRQGRVGMVIAGVFMLQEANRQTDLRFAGAPVPVLGDKPAAWAGSHNLCMKPGLDDRHRSAVSRFFRFLSDHTLEWAQAGQVPVRKALRDDPRFKAMPLQSTFARQIDYVQYMPSTTYTLEYQTEFDVAGEAVLRAARSPQQAIDLAAARIRAAAARFKPAGGEA